MTGIKQATFEIFFEYSTKRGTTISQLQARDLNLVEITGDASLILAFKLSLSEEQAERLGIKQWFRETSRRIMIEARSAAGMGWLSSSGDVEWLIQRWSPFLAQGKWESWLGGNWTWHCGNEEIINILSIFLDDQKSFIPPSMRDK